MARSTGTKNADYDEKRRKIIDALIPFVFTREGAHASFRAMADAAAVSPATLRHYFDSREGTILALFESLHDVGEPHWEHIRSGFFELGTRDGLHAALSYMVRGWREFGVGNLHAFGLHAGLNDDRLGPAYLEELLDPTLAAFTSRIAALQRRGELSTGDPRLAALMLVGPVFTALLHQIELSGEAGHPLDWDTFLAEAVDRFYAAYKP
ncbi:MAG: TetR/AcrR family transcriptional regulator [bacterium]